MKNTSSNLSARLNPSGPRVVGLDTLNIIITAVIVFLAFTLDNALYLDIALVYGILAFLETVLFARFLEGRR